MSNKTKPDTIHVEGRRWFDQVNGNTYHSARVTLDGVLQIAVPFQYGYDEQYLQSALEALDEIGYVKRVRYSSGGEETLKRICEDSGIAFSHNVIDVRTQQEVKEFGLL